MWKCKEHGPQRGERASGASGVLVSTQPQAEQASMMVQSDRIHSAFTVPSTAPLGPLQPPVSLESPVCFINYFVLYVVPVAPSLFININIVVLIYISLLKDKLFDYLLYF